MVKDMLFKSWAEAFFVVLLIIGFVLALSSQNPALTYAVSFLAGLLAGRYYFVQVGKQPLFPFFLIIIGFLIGYIIGSFNANRWIVAILFFLAWLSSHMFHKKGYIK